MNFNVTREPTPFPGYLYRPDVAEKVPAVMILHGSEGGNGNFWYEPGASPRTGENAPAPSYARRLAASGFAALAFCYFDARHLPGYGEYPPDELVNVDLGKTCEAIRWLRNQPFVNGKVFLEGGSRGAEHALLLGSLGLVDDGMPDRMIASSPVGYVAGQFTRQTALQIIHGQEEHWPRGPAWTYNSTSYAPGEVIPFEKYQRPTLMIGFDEDPVWGREKTLKDMVDNLRVAKTSFFYRDFQEDGSPEQTLEKFKASTETILILNFQMTGHVAPYAKRYPNASKLYNDLTQWFLGTW